MSGVTNVAELAALAICEPLSRGLNDHKILPENEILGILTDAAAAHENAPPGDGAAHKAVAVLINTIIDGGNSVRLGQGQAQINCAPRQIAPNGLI